MKKLVSTFSIIAVVVACNSKPQTDVNTIVKAYQDSVKLAADTAGLAEFHAWKAQNELVNNQNVNEQNGATAPEAQTVTYTPSRRTTSSSKSRSSGSGGTMRSESGNTAKAPAKKGWSKAAKGAAIGAGAGAIGGAIINKKNRAVGAVIGGVLGGGVGYGIGRSKDKKDGRY